MKFFIIATRHPSLLASCILLLSVFGCQRRGENMVATPISLVSLDSIPQTRLDTLSQKKIFFGHQSVGVNILDGLNDIMKQSPRIHLSIRRSRSPQDLNQPVFAESPVGVNENPGSKIDDFRAVMESGVGARVDIAFFKLCFVDINAATDVDALFTHYKTVMDGLYAEFPKVRFIHCTVPLTKMDSGIKLAVKKLLGKDGGGGANLKRAAYNQKVTDTYQPEGIVFDIARYESTFPNGTRMVRRIDGKDCYGLVAGYTDDGGHLNRTGRVIVAKGLLELLVAMQ
jgi:hypothetical protein